MPWVWDSCVSDASEFTFLGIGIPGVGISPVPGMFVSPNSQIPGMFDSFFPQFLDV